MDVLTIIGLLLGVAAIVGGQILEGGHISAILQPTAALIVFGGTLGAVFVQYSFRTVVDALVLAGRTFLVRDYELSDIIPEITTFSRFAQREGILALEKKLPNVGDPFFKKGLQLVVDGVTIDDFKDILEIEIDHVEERRHLAAKVFDSAGGYAPTIGILGAVLGLIHVMENLADPSMLGQGIAVAFVATVYGVGSANLIWLPIAGKIKQKTRDNTIQKELIVEGLLSMLSGESPRLIEERLEGFVSKSPWRERERGFYEKKE